MSTSLRSSSVSGMKPSVKGRKALFPVQPPSADDQTITSVGDKTEGVLDRGKNVKAKVDIKGEAIEIVGKENSGSHKSMSKFQLKSKASKQIKKSISDKKNKTPKVPSNQSKISFESVKKDEVEVTPGYEFLIAEPPLKPESETLTEEEQWWKEIAETHEMALQFALWENEKLRKERDSLEKENETLLQALEYSSQLVDMIEKYQATPAEENVE